MNTCNYCVHLNAVSLCVCRATPYPSSHFYFLSNPFPLCGVGKGRQARLLICKHFHFHFHWNCHTPDCVCVCVCVVAIDKLQLQLQLLLHLHMELHACEICLQHPPFPLPLLRLSFRCCPLKMSQRIQRERETHTQVAASSCHRQRQVAVASWQLVAGGRCRVAAATVFKFP